MTGVWGASLRDRASRAAHGALSGLRRPATIACAYAVVAVFTFGHDASSPHRCAIGEKVEHCEQATIAIGAFIGAVLWPLYWSWDIQS